MAKRKSSQARQAKRANTRKKASAKASEETKMTTEEMFRQDYAYVLRDLQQVLILAVLLFALLVAINVILG